MNSRFEVSHSNESLESTPIFEPCAKCGKKQKWGATSAYCRECMHEYMRNYYIKNKEAILDKQRQDPARQRGRKRKRKEELVKRKGGKCVRCGYDKNFAALVFHHPNGRKGSCARILPSENPASGKFNIDEVVLVCENCHKELHHPECQNPRILEVLA